MDYFKLISRRRSIRRYSGKSVSLESVNVLLESANISPSAGNLQAYEIVVVTDPTIKRRLSYASLNQSYVAEAPVDLVFLADPERSRRSYGKRGVLYSIQDATIAATHAMLAAVPLGLGTCWVGAFSDEDVLEIVEAPRRMIPVAILTVGYPGEHPRPTSRRGVENLTPLNKFGGLYPYKPVNRVLQRPRS